MQCQLRLENGTVIVPLSDNEPRPGQLVHHPDRVRKFRAVANDARPLAPVEIPGHGRKFVTVVTVEEVPQLCGAGGGNAGTRRYFRDPAVRG